MPIYEYHCETCGKNFEFLTFGSEKPKCEFCNSQQINRLISTCGFVSKGKAGEVTRQSASASSCSGCSSTSCGSCSA
ncbi:MAG: zinc ribbon domain-containing protein [Desulfobacterales bacterium]|nr:zinc ribbon domain-containing protein [Desulfobacterales bacterium]